MRDVFVETALNGPWGRARQPLMPITVAALIAEGVACAEAGAAVIHLHVYDPATGAQWEDPDAYAAAIEGIRARADVIVYPTLPLAGAPGAAEMPPAARFATVEVLAKAGLLEWAVIDPGSAQFTDLAALPANLPDGPPGFLYRNSEEDLRHGLLLARNYGFHPSYAIYEPGFLRLGAALARAMAAPQPIYRFMFSDGFSFGFPPRPWALDAYLALLAECHPGAPWMVAGLRVDLDPLFDAALARGGHVRVGLEDAAFGCTASNLDLTRAAVARLRAQGYQPGTAAGLRAHFNT